MVDGSVIKFNAHFSATNFHLLAVKFEPLSVMMLWGTPYRCTTPDMKSITGLDSVVFTGLASIHLVNLSTMTNKYFFLMASPFKGSDHVQPPDRKRPSNGDGS